MDAITPSQQERMEVELVLQSGIFDKAPRLGKFFRYICDLYFEGRADQIKEYSIALEALGRTAEFDPKKDSIVRVEAHRLRKRLEEYYRGAGAGSAVQIVIPNGQYRPHFVARENGTSSGIEAGSERDAEIPDTGQDFAPVGLAPAPKVEAPKPRLRPGIWVPLVAMLLIVCSVTALFAWRKMQKNSRLVLAPANEVWSGSSAEPVPEGFRMLAGYHGVPFVDRQGHTWGPDAYYSGGLSTAIPPEHLIEAQPDPHLLKAQRSGQFRYDIPLRQGTHELRLYFAETEFGDGNRLGGGEGNRTFNVSINGVPEMTLLDPLAEAGAPNRLHERVFKDATPASDGKLHLKFDPVSAPAILNAIEILPSPAGHVHPIRIVTQSNPVTDSDGRVWAADEYFCGGTLVVRRNVVVNPQEKALYQGERYGNFSYHIPLATGKYRLTLHFAETWFGTPESRLPAADSRVFNVFANGVALLRDYQIVKDAGGPNRSIDKVFENLEPNAQGVLVLEFVPVKNYAEVNAIEVVETR